MAKRKYKGPPIDATEQYITERPFNDGGETVAGTSKDKEDVVETLDEFERHGSIYLVPTDSGKEVRLT